MSLMQGHYHLLRQNRRKVQGKARFRVIVMAFRVWAKPWTRLNLAFVVAPVHTTGTSGRGYRTKVTNTFYGFTTRCSDLDHT
jgi:hypothetical protein